MHQGDCMLEGHYFAYIRSGAAWFLANDDVITAVTTEEALGAQAYMLFYCKSAMDGPAAAVQSEPITQVRISTQHPPCALVPPPTARQFNSNACRMTLCSTTSTRSSLHRRSMYLCRHAFHRVQDVTAQSADAVQASIERPPQHKRKRTTDDEQVRYLEHIVFSIIVSCDTKAGPTPINGAT